VTIPDNILLSVNLNKIALIRNSREGDTPRVEDFANLCIASGAKGITVHPRPDQRHIRPKDVYALAEITRQHQVEFNIEGNPFAPAKGDYPGLIELARDTRPNQCTLVPDSDSQLTSDHGFDLTQDYDKLYPIVQDLKALNIRVSLFMDPDPAQIQLVNKLGADRIELYTGPFAWAFDKSPEDAEDIFKQHCIAAQTACDLGLGVNAGHDLNLANMTRYKDLPGLKEVSIGHALTIDGLMKGFAVAVKEYLSVCN